MRDWIDKITLAIGILLIVALLVGAYWLVQARTLPPTASGEQMIVVDIAGAVQQPGVYEFSEGAIVEDAISKAGGISPDANLELLAKTVNRAGLLTDHSKVYIPTLGGTATESSILPKAGNHLVNINTASAALLDTLPGIGPITAARIIEYRDQHRALKS